MSSHQLQRVILIREGRQTLREARSHWGTSLKIANLTFIEHLRFSVEKARQWVVKVVRGQTDIWAPHPDLLVKIVRGPSQKGVTVQTHHSIRRRGHNDNQYAKTNNISFNLPGSPPEWMSAMFNPQANPSGQQVNINLGESAPIP